MSSSFCKKSISKFNTGNHCVTYKNALGIPHNETGNILDFLHFYSAHFEGVFVLTIRYSFVS